MAQEYEPTDKFPKQLTPDIIYEQTGFKLAMSFPNFGINLRITSEFREQFEWLSEQYGDNNILPSLYLDKESKLQLGLFLRQPGDPEIFRENYEI